jgi:hypothetical protein
MEDREHRSRWQNTLIFEGKEKKCVEVGVILMVPLFGGNV